MIIVGAWAAFDLENLFFNDLAGPLTNKVRVYPVEGKGKVVPGNFCCGTLDVPLYPTTFAVSVSRQQVFESTAGFITPLHNCEIQDRLNWQCTTYWDATGEHETDMPHGQCSDQQIMQGGSSDECL
jgi:hypothetical protein